MQNASDRSPRRLVALILSLATLALALGAALPLEPRAEARPCCSQCPQYNMEDPCWDVCAFC